MSGLPHCVATVTVVVFDRSLDSGPERDRRSRYEAELVGYGVVRGRGASPWEAVHRLVAGHRALLERRWSEEALR